MNPTSNAPAHCAPKVQEDYHPYFDYFTLDSAINRLETTALAGVPDSAKYLRNIALSATTALQRIALNCSESSPADTPPGSSCESIEHRKFEENVSIPSLAKLAQIISKLDPNQISEIHARYLNNESSESPNFTFSALIFPASPPLKSNQKKAAELVSAMICRRLEEARCSQVGELGKSHQSELVSSVLMR